MKSLSIDFGSSKVISSSYFFFPRWFSFFFQQANGVWVSGKGFWQFFLFFFLSATGQMGLELGKRLGVLGFAGMGVGVLDNFWGCGFRDLGVCAAG